MAALIYGKKTEQPIAAARQLNSDFKTYDKQPPRLNNRVSAQTRLGGFTIGLAGLAAVLYLLVKYLQWSRFGGLVFGWFDWGLAVLVVLTIAFFIAHRLHRAVPSQGGLRPSNLFFREDKQMVQLTRDQGELWPRTAVAGPVPSGSGVTVGRQVFVDYEIDGRLYRGQGSLFPGDTPAMVHLDGVPTFAVWCDPRRPTRPVRVTEFDYDAAPGEAS